MPYLLGIGWEEWKLSKISLAKLDSVCMWNLVPFLAPDL